MCASNSACLSHISTDNTGKSPCQATEAELWCADEGGWRALPRALRYASERYPVELVCCPVAILPDNERCAACRSGRGTPRAAGRGSEASGGPGEGAVSLIHLAHCRVIQFHHDSPEGFHSLDSCCCILQLWSEILDTSQMPLEQCGDAYHRRRIGLNNKGAHAGCFLERATWESNSSEQWQQEAQNKNIALLRRRPPPVPPMGLAALRGHREHDSW